MSERHYLKLNLLLDRTTIRPKIINKIRAAPKRLEPIQAKAQFQDFQEPIGAVKAPGVQIGLAPNSSRLSILVMVTIT